MCGNKVTHWLPLVILCPTLTMNGHMQQRQAETHIISRSSDHSGIRIQVTHPKKSLRPAEVIGKGEECWKWILWEGSNISCCPETTEMNYNCSEHCQLIPPFFPPLQNFFSGEAHVNNGFAPMGGSVGPCYTRDSLWLSWEWETHLSS